MGTCISSSPAETEALGESWGQTVQHGVVIALCGELGAGKTQLVKGLARGLGISARVHSPTFTLLNIYNGGRLTLFHLDLYRLETREEVSLAGLEDYFHPDGVAVIEWADRWFGSWNFENQSTSQQSKVPELRPAGTQQTGLENQALPARFRWVQIETLNETQRKIAYEDFSA
jgi:tRNA threonylcarbamoyladenosine biosynthesis protein TsaE